ncbi:MAG: IS1 family transposase, partial [Gemmatimonadota bacterium]|nr:IS1 family transposase [Gemmatimonadota bacterium]
WSFVRCKAQVRWLWIALCRRTRQGVACVVGDRSEQTCRRLWEKIPEDYRLALCYSDFWKAYQSVIPEEQHAPVEKSSGQTNHVERWNLTLRQRLGRFVRRTLSFSKSDHLHEITLRLFLHEYNRSRARDPLYQP